MANVNITDTAAVKVLKLVEGQIAALHNHIASAVERPDHWNGTHTAESMVIELREHQKIAADLRSQINGTKPI